MFLFCFVFLTLLCLVAGKCEEKKKTVVGLMVVLI